MRDTGSDTRNDTRSGSGHSVVLCVCLGSLFCGSRRLRSEQLAGVTPSSYGEVRLLLDAMQEPPGSGVHWLLSPRTRE